MSVTLKHLNEALDTLNSRIKHQGIEVVLGRRYGYKAFDLYHTKEKGGGCIDTLKSGFTSGQALEYIWALLKGISLYTWNPGVKV